MEHLEGTRPRQTSSTVEGPLPVDEACEIALQACEALAEVHAAGIVHRDLKPSNLFVTRRADGSPAVKLLDFGISKLTVERRRTGEDPALTATATIMGSPSYMSPEQLKSTKEVDAADGRLVARRGALRGAHRQARVPRREPSRRCAR